MRKIFLIIIIVLIPISLIAQRPVLSEDFMFSMGEKYKHQKGLNSYYVAHGEHMLSVKKTKKGFVFQRFKLSDLKEDIKLRQTIEDKGDFETITKIGNRAALFYSNKNKVYGQFISLSHKSITAPIQLINEKNGVSSNYSFQSTYKFDSGGRIHKFGIKKSANGDKVVIVYKLKSKEDQKSKIAVQVFNNRLELEWKKKFVLEVVDDRVINEDFSVDNQGNFFMTASIFTEEVKKKDKATEIYKTKVYTIDAEEQNLSSQTIKLGANVVQEAIIDHTAKGMAVIGLYTIKENSAIATGMFKKYIKDSEDAIQMSKFPEEKVSQLALERTERINEGTQKEKDKQDFENLKINAVFSTQDGGEIVLAEQRYVTRHSSSSSSGGRMMFRSYYNDIYAFKLSANGEMIWFYKMPKSQMGMRGKGSMSYYPFEYKNKYYLLFIDDFTNLKKELKETPTKYYDGKKEFLYLTAFVLDNSEGTIKKEPLLTGRDIRNARLEHLRVSKIIRVNNDFLMEAYDGKKNDLLVKLSGVK